MPDAGRGHVGKGHFICPHCGAEVARRALACPECGSDDKTGWAEDANKWRAGIPTGYSNDGDFDYEEFVRREFSHGEGRILGLPVGLFLLLIALLFAGTVVAFVFLAH